MTLRWVANGAETVFKRLFDAGALKWLKRFHDTRPDKFTTAVYFEPHKDVHEGVLVYDLNVRITNNEPSAVGMNSERWQLKFKLHYDVNEGFAIESIKGQYSVTKDGHNPTMNLREEDFPFIFKTIALEVRRVMPPKMTEEALVIPAACLESFLEIDEQEKVPKFITELGSNIAALGKDPELVKLLLSMDDGQNPPAKQIPTLN